MEIPSGSYGYGLPFLAILTVLVFVHELGHYLIARLNGVRVEVFSIGFGPELFGWTDKAKTRWKFSLIPLGGYVKMFGDADAASRPDAGLSELSDEERAEAFPYKRLSQRSWIVAAGPIANFLFAVVLLAGVFMAVGQPFTPPAVGEVIPDSAAEQAGLLPGDRILRIDGTDIQSFQDIQLIVSLGLDEAIEIVVLRDGTEIALTATPVLTEITDDFGNQQKVGRLGISHSGVELVRHGPLTALWRATEKTGAYTVAILKAVGQMIVGDRSATELGGPLRIAKIGNKLLSRATPCTTPAPVAQLAEQLTLNQWVEGSTPSGRILLNYAAMAKLADALDLGSSPLTRMGVRVPPLAVLFVICLYCPSS